MLLERTPDTTSTPATPSLGVLSTLSCAQLTQLVGRELGVGVPVIVTQEQIDAFAGCTGDRQWMHVDVERSRRESPYGGTVAHGFLLLALLARLLDELAGVPEDAAGVINTGLNNVRFRAPVRAGSRVRVRARLAGVAPLGDGRNLVTTSVALEVADDAGATDAVAVTADLFVLVFR
ncbi:MaoC/PaaZ C-terminal domain-containing protein [Solimonas variicoloris]|uniref:MaoC/PaaZ C-terminal domain-containing protein n=1 Tax=Solimonas variicoloris TaxID=254408 RepID=UPI0003A0677D|nr:MaoC/PaaZ C-terminal domain-containing protein [Solimonas variicoloris]